MDYYVCSPIPCERLVYPYASEDYRQAPRSIAECVSTDAGPNSHHTLELQVEVPPDPWPDYEPEGSEKLLAWRPRIRVVSIDHKRIS